jgi:hypothetical protein
MACTIDAYRDRYLAGNRGSLSEVGINADISMLQWAFGRRQASR